jgi:hypothetical protein
LALEGEYAFLPMLKVRTFIDAGDVRQYVDNNFNGGATDNHLVYSGYGLGLTFEPAAQTSFQGIWARRFANNPNPLPSGNDQDGTLLTDRFWLSGQINF